MTVSNRHSGKLGSSHRYSLSPMDPLADFQSNTVRMHDAGRGWGSGLPFNPRP